MTHTPYKPPPKTYGADSQKPAEEDNTELLDKYGIQGIQQIVCTILYYARAIDCTVGAALSTISNKQTNKFNRKDKTKTSYSSRLPVHTS